MVANRAKIQGWDAYHAGRSTDSNPYPYGSANHRDWEAGWKEAWSDDMAQAGARGVMDE